MSMIEQIKWGYQMASEFKAAFFNEGTRVSQLGTEPLPSTFASAMGVRSRAHAIAPLRQNNIRKPTP